MWTQPIAGLLAVSYLLSGAPVLDAPDVGNVAKASGIYTYEGHSYCIYGGQNMSWLDTPDYCQKLGGTLACINTEEEQYAIENMMTDYLETYPDEVECCTTVNIGLIYLRKEEQWTWIEDVYRFQYDEDWISYTNWDELQPDNHYGEDWYGTLRTQSIVYEDWEQKFGKWDDYEGNTSETMYFLCEWDYDITGQTIGMMTLRDMQDSTVFSGHSYKLMQDIGNWYVADAYCKVNGGHLVSVNSELEQLFLDDFLKKEREDNPDLEDAMTGGYHPINDDSIWNWSDGSAFTYEKWYGNMPDNRYGFENTIKISAVTEEGSTYCLPGEEERIYKNYLGYWNDSIAGGKYSICEWDFDVSALTLGDVDISGTIDIMDIIKLNKFLLGSASLSDPERLCADVDGNGIVDSTDSLNILKFVVEMIPDFDEL